MDSPSSESSRNQKGSSDTLPEVTDPESKIHQGLIIRLLKYKLRHTKIFKSFFEQKLILIGQHQTGSSQEHSNHRS